MYSKGTLTHTRHNILNKILRAFHGPYIDSTNLEFRYSIHIRFILSLVLFYELRVQKINDSLNIPSKDCFGKSYSYHDTLIMQCGQLGIELKYFLKHISC